MENAKTVKEKMMKLTETEIKDLLTRNDFTEEGKLWWLAYQILGIFDNGFADMPALEVRSTTSENDISGFSNEWYDYYRKKAEEEGREIMKY